MLTLEIVIFLLCSNLKYIDNFREYLRGMWNCFGKIVIYFYLKVLFIGNFDDDVDVFYFRVFSSSSRWSRGCYNG